MSGCPMSGASGLDAPPRITRKQAQGCRRFGFMISKEAQDAIRTGEGKILTITVMPTGDISVLRSPFKNDPHTCPFCKTALPVNVDHEKCPVCGGPVAVTGASG